MGIRTLHNVFVLLCCVGLLCGHALCAVGPPVVSVSPDVVRLPLADANDIRFSHLSGAQGLSQRRVTSILQDRQGFMWFGTQYGLNRYDGYRFRVFKHEPDDPHSLSGVSVYALFLDHLGTMWVASGAILDRFDARTETFAHYIIDAEPSPDVANTVRNISEDSRGALWLSTARGLYRLDPTTGIVVRFHHDPDDPLSLSSDDVKWSGTDREGTLWVANATGLDAYDAASAHVTLHVPLAEPHELSFYEDKAGSFWILYASGDGLALLDRQERRLTRYSWAPDAAPDLALTGAISMVEDRAGNLWIGTLADGILRFERGAQRFVRYRNDAANPESLTENRITTLYQDREGDIWAGLGATEPAFIRAHRSLFRNLPFDSGNRANLGETLVNTIYEDHRGILWTGTTGALNRFDRFSRTYQHYDIPGHGVASDVLAVVEDDEGQLWIGTSGHGLYRFDRDTGSLRAYRHSDTDAASLSNDTVTALLSAGDHILWVATADGLNRFDTGTGHFRTFRVKAPGTAAKYPSMARDATGALWLGSFGSGLLRFDPRTAEFEIFRHRQQHGRTVSNDHVNAVFIDRKGLIWAGTHDGLDVLDPKTGQTRTFSEKDGLPSNAVACILADSAGRLWMSTTNGLSRFDPGTGEFRNFSSPDGLPGTDLTGYSACYQTSNGDMYFGGFAGAVRFSPQSLGEDTYEPPVVLTGIELNGTPVGSGRTLQEAVTYLRRLSLRYDQNNLSFEFAALSYAHSGSNRYRYMLEGLESGWRNVDASRRSASYTILPPGSYVFRIQAATSRGPWSRPGVELAITIEPPWWATWWFRGAALAVALMLVASSHFYRVRGLRRQFEVRLEERVGERTRIARELHDSLLQGFQGLLYRLQALRNIAPEHSPELVAALDAALDKGDQTIIQARAAVQDLRASGIEAGDLEAALTALREEFAQPNSPNQPTYRVVVEGKPRALSPLVRDDLYQVAREAFRNAYRHAQARHIEAEIDYGETVFTLRVRDDGAGIEPEVLGRGRRSGHFGLQGMRERSERAGGTLSVWSERNVGTEVEVTIPAQVAYGRI
jgi:ligand-binding sensor domain-containing protein/signal transduction histidine kinase